MPLLTTEEACNVSDSFLLTLYGSETFTKWKSLKEEMQFGCEREYVAWLIEVASHYRSGSLEHGYYMSDAGEDIEYIDTNSCTDNDQYQSVEDNFSSSTTGTVMDCAHQRVSTRQVTKVENLKLELETQQVTRTTHQPDVTYGDFQQAGGRENILLTGSSSIKCEQLCTPAPDDSIISDADDRGSGTHIITDHSLSKATEASDSSKPEVSIQPVSQQSQNKLCPYCPYSSPRNDLISKHVLAIHKHLKPFSCHYCHYRCAQKATLDGHLIHKHGYKSNYHCDKCGKYFLTPSKCRGHIQNCNNTNTTTTNTST